MPKQESQVTGRKAANRRQNVLVVVGPAYRGHANELVEGLQGSGCSARMIEVSSNDVSAISDIKHERFTKVIVNADHGAEGKEPVLYWGHYEDVPAMKGKKLEE